MSTEDIVFVVLAAFGITYLVVDVIRERRIKREHRRLLTENERLRAEVRKLPRRGLRVINGGRR